MRERGGTGGGGYTRCMETARAGGRAGGSARPASLSMEYKHAALFGSVVPRLLMFGSNSFGINAPCGLVPCLLHHESPDPDTLVLVLGSRL